MSNLIKKEREWCTGLVEGLRRFGDGERLTVTPWEKKEWWLGTIWEIGEEKEKKLKKKD